MTFLKQNKNGNHSISEVHHAVRIETQGNNLCVLVSSYANKEAFDANLLNWQQHYQLPIDADSIRDPESYLIGETGPFAGAERLPTSGIVEQAQALKHAQMKDTRDRLRLAGFTYLGVVFDSDAEARDNMTAATARAAKADAEGDANWYVVWTLADNTTRQMNSSEVRGMIPALYDYGESLQIKYSMRKAQIYADRSEDETDEQAAARINAIMWDEMPQLLT